MDKLKSLYLRYKEQINYIIVGGLTTVVNWLAYYLLMLAPVFASGENTVRVFGGEYRVGYLLANALAFVAAVVFSYFANRNFVFENKVHGLGAVCRQFGVFVATRLLSFAIEEALMFAAVELAGLGELAAKIPVAVVVVILNYIFGKLIVFRRRGSDSDPE